MAANKTSPNEETKTQHNPSQIHHIGLQNHFQQQGNIYNALRANDHNRNSNVSWLS